MTLLKVENLSVNYGSIRAVREISFEVNQGEIVTLIGSNGAGKTTTMNTIAGLKELNGGKIFWNGADATAWNAKRKVKEGIVLSPEGRQVFPDFSVYDNLMLGGYHFSNEENQKTLRTVHELFPVLEKREKQMAGTLSGGEQQMLAIGRALMSPPELLMPDEAAMGPAPPVVKEIFSLIRRIREEMGTTVLLVEQNARMALKISDRAYVLQTGKITLEGSSKELLQSEEVQKAYLGM